MSLISLGVIAFLLFVIYDINSIIPVLFIKTKLIPSDPLKIEDTGKS
jgi:hypothetical protein